MNKSILLWKINLYYKKKLGFPQPWESFPIGTLDHKVREFQVEHGGLTVDGVLGPKTLAAIRGDTWTHPIVDHIIIDGKKELVPFPVVTWEEPSGMSFIHQDGWRRRKDPTGKRINLLVIHWDACKSSHQCFHVLMTRNLSVHFMIDGDGTVYQALDLARARAWHAGAANDRSIGVEVQNPVLPALNHTQDPTRVLIKENRVHGSGMWGYLDFYDIQKNRVAQVAEKMCDLFKIPRVLPMRGGSVSRYLAPPRYRGVCGHFHLSKKKRDPGLSIFERLFQEKEKK